MRQINKTINADYNFAPLYVKTVKNLAEEGEIDTIWLINDLDPDMHAVVFRSQIPGLIATLCEAWGTGDIEDDIPGHVTFR